MSTSDLGSHGHATACLMTESRDGAKTLPPARLPLSHGAVEEASHLLLLQT
jgi:hypothetical protein